MLIFEQPHLRMALLDPRGAKLGGCIIIRFRSAKGVSHVEYENGLSMIINYNHRTYIDGQTNVPALSYTVIGEEVGA